MCAPGYQMRNKCCPLGCGNCTTSSSAVAGATSALVDTCLACDTGYFNSTQGCISSCPNGQFGDPTTGSCANCSANCLQCSSASQCSLCATGLFLISGQCSASVTCPTGTWSYNGGWKLYNAVMKAFQNASDVFGYGPGQSCQSCALFGCSACNMTHCLSGSCLSGLAYYAGANATINPYNNTPYFAQCVPACPGGFYKDASSVCQKCASSCAACANTATACLVCAPGLYQNPLDASCVPPTSCPAGFFADQTYLKCSACPSSCATCLSATACLTCRAGFSLSASQCLNNCPAGYFYNTTASACAKCHFYCATCFAGAYNNCLSCPTNQYLSNSQCVATCPSGQFASAADATCKQCLPPALTCLNSSLALSCAPGTFLQNGVCANQVTLRDFERENERECVRESE